MSRTPSKRPREGALPLYLVSGEPRPVPAGACQIVQLAPQRLPLPIGVR